MFSFLQHTFMVYALLLALLIALAAALLSPFLVLSKQSLIADGMAHIAFTGVVIGLLFSNEPLYIALPFALLASIAITFLTERANLDNDAAIGVVSVFALALGLIIISKSDGFNRSVESLLVGSLLTVTVPEIIGASVLALLVICFILIFYRKLIITTFDVTHARFAGVNTMFLKYALSALTSIFVVVGVRAIGALLISAFILFPTLISRQLSKSFNMTLWGGVIISLIATFIGITVSYHFTLPTGPAIIMVFTTFLVVAYIIRIIIAKRRLKDAPNARS
ncbi:MAG: metal ABC transporter permease [Bacilli bacterium]|jgi:zinc transport system permease protein|nr:metal ABC transporter permease [Bacillota bacterium]NLI51761.1 metal ABC transporter permease [Erysipelotrichaceae bacterium]OQC49266.1 MAG: Manganese transport system membrane protein MntB [Tenericutes bacterium ADurb.Bin024]HOM32089.1 metal ABC transporter permease [Bacilli bacterium]HPY78505.1 metal ABC transporter permease [Bacilli bacterium]